MNSCYIWKVKKKERKKRKKEWRRKGRKEEKKKKDYKKNNNSSKRTQGQMNEKNTILVLQITKKQWLYNHVKLKKITVI